MAEHEHDEKLIERLAATTEGNAYYHEALSRAQERSEEDSPERWSQHQMLAASGFAIAASYWSLINARRAVELYRLATKKYRELGHSYWMPLALASVNAEQAARMAYAIDEMPSPSPTAVAFAMVGSSMPWVERDRMERVQPHWEHTGNVPVGRLGIPMDIYGVCARAMSDAFRKKDFEGFQTAATAYLNRAAEVVRAATHDEYHWSILQSAILPAEPEAVAMAIAMSIVSRSVFGMPMTKMAPDLDRHSRILVEVAEEMHEAGSEPAPRARTT